MTSENSIPPSCHQYEPDEFPGSAVGSSRLQIYLVSLKSDLERRDALRSRFKATYKFFQHVVAVDGRDLSARYYYERILPHFLRTGSIMSPAELGCALSHMKALNLFLETSSEFALILEDDVIGDDASVAWVAKKTGDLTENAVVLCGGQEGLNQRYQLGRQVRPFDMYRLAQFSYGFVYRTCCYLVTRKSAQEILACQERSLTLADMWGEFFKMTDTQIYFCKKFAHPEDLSSSHVEPDRAVFQKTTLMEKLLARDAPRKLVRRVCLELQRGFVLMCGYRGLESDFMRTKNAKNGAHKNPDV